MAVSQNNSGAISPELLAGALLMGAAILAMVVANTPLSQFYNLLIDIPVEVHIGTFSIAKPLLLWVNDGLMAIFFLVVGFELKREFLEGELATKGAFILPGIGALGGMVIPALIYVAVNYEDPEAISGWAIPAATDIAFALGVLSLLGSRVPLTLKIFLTSLAIFDDVGAIIIIALFYTSKISVVSLITALVCMVVLFTLNRNNVTSKSPYILVGVVMWAAMLKSGVHATLAGVVLALMIPIKCPKKPGYSPLKELEEDLHLLSAFFILPVFAFCNAGIDFRGLEISQIIHPIPVGIALGLFVGKQIGIFGFCWLAIKTGLAKLPEGMNNLSLYGTSLLCGIGFTMSLFIGSLAFEGSGVNIIVDERIGIIFGSLLSGVLGYLILQRALPEEKPASNVEG